MKNILAFFIFVFLRLCASGQDDPIEHFGEKLPAITDRLVSFRMAEERGFRVTESAETGEKLLELKFKVVFDRDYWESEGKKIYLDLINQIRLSPNAIRNGDKEPQPFEETVEVPFKTSERARLQNYFHEVIAPTYTALSTKLNGELVRQEISAEIIPPLSGENFDWENPKVDYARRLPRIILIDSKTLGQTNAICHQYYLPKQPFSRLQSILSRKPRPVGLHFSLKSASGKELQTIDMDYSNPYLGVRLDRSHFGDHEMQITGAFMGFSHFWVDCTLTAVVRVSPEVISQLRYVDLTHSISLEKEKAANVTPFTLWDESTGLAKIVILSFSCLTAILCLCLSWVVYPYTLAPIAHLVWSPLQIMFGRFSTAVSSSGLAFVAAFLILLHYFHAPKADKHEAIVTVPRMDLSDNIVSNAEPGNPISPNKPSSEDQKAVTKSVADTDNSKKSPIVPPIVKMESNATTSSKVQGFGDSQKPMDSSDSTDLKLKLVELEGELAVLNLKIETERKRWTDANNVINTLTNNKTTPVLRDSPEHVKLYQSQVIMKQVEQIAPVLKVEKAKLEAMIHSLQKSIFPKFNNSQLK